VIELVTGNGAERPPEGKRQNSSALRFGRAIHFSYPHLKQATARHRSSKIVLVYKNKGIGGLACASIPARKALA